MAKAHIGTEYTFASIRAWGPIQNSFCRRRYDDDPEWIHRDEVQEMIKTERSARPLGHVLADTAESSNISHTRNASLGDDDAQHVKMPAATFEAKLLSMQPQQSRTQQDMTCRDFLATGSCSRFNCRYTYVAPGSTKTQPPSVAGGSAIFKPTVQNPFLPKV